MFSKIRLLSAVSGLALGAATTGTALANIPADGLDVQPENGTSAGISKASSPLIEFLTRTEGVLTPESVDRAIRSMYVGLTREQAETLPDFFLEVRGLALGKRVEQAALEAMGALIVESPQLAQDPDLQMEIAAVLGSRAHGPVLPIRVAQAGLTGPIQDDLCIYDPTEPNYRLDPDCPPLETQAIVPPGPPPGVPPSYNP